MPEPFPERVLDQTIPLPFEPAIGRRAREIVQHHLRPFLSEDTEQDLELLVNELATNAYRHSREPVELRLTGTDRGVRVEVRDGSPVAPTVGPGSAEGWGMLLVSQLAERWGTEPTSNGKAVWAELPAQWTRRP